MSKIRYNPFAKVQRIHSPRYLNFIRSIPCIVTGMKDAEAHHESFQNGSTARKCSDIFALPLLSTYHEYEGGPLSIHRLGWKEFERVHNVDLRDIILRQIEYFISQGGKF